MWLTLTNIINISVTNSLLFFLLSIHLHGYERNYQEQMLDLDSIVSLADAYYETGRYQLAIKEYEKALYYNVPDSTKIYKQLAYCNIKNDSDHSATDYVEKYIKASLDVSFAEHSYFDQLQGSKMHQKVFKSYKKDISFEAFFYLFIGFLGLLMAVLLNLKNAKDKTANFLISFFILLNSFFIIQLFLIITNHQYYLPHALHIPAAFSLLYGPLIYFYFKRVRTGYILKKIDVIHLLPTLILISFLIPIYLLPKEEKLKMMINNDSLYADIISLVKLISLFFYGILITRIHINFKKDKKNHISKLEHTWIRNIIIICSLYTILYTLYTVLTIKSVETTFLLHLQSITMGIFILYISYMAFVQPSIFRNSIIIDEKTSTEDKLETENKDRYQNSGLTPSLSLELKEKLTHLLDNEKVFKQNDLTLQKLSEYLGTTRHNTSQVINEHFSLNFFDLINTYRITEAKRLLEIKSSDHNNLNIIDIAYEVGFNNKVSFNRSFKKYNKTTPSEYIKSLVA